MGDRERIKASIRKSLKKRRAELKEQGWCVDCGFLRRQEGHVLCGDCLASRRVRERARVKKKETLGAVALISGGDGSTNRAWEKP